MKSRHDLTHMREAGWVDMSLLEPQKRIPPRRCPKCNAVLQDDAERCYECALLEKIGPDDQSENEPLGRWQKALEYADYFGVPIDQIAAAILCGLWLIYALIRYGIAACLYSIVALLIPIVMIWFSEDVATFTGTVSMSTVTRESPPQLIKFLGWVALIAAIGICMHSLANGRWG